MLKWLYEDYIVFFIHVLIYWNVIVYISIFPSLSLSHPHPFIHLTVLKIYIFIINFYWQFFLNKGSLSFEMIKWPFWIFVNCYRSSSVMDTWFSSVYHILATPRAFSLHRGAKAPGLCPETSIFTFKQWKPYFKRLIKIANVNTNANAYFPDVFYLFRIYLCNLHDRLLYYTGVTERLG